MRKLATLCVPLAFLVACGLFGGTTASDNSITVNVADLQGTGTQARGGAFVARLVTARYDNSTKVPGTSVGMSVVTGTPGALETDVCKSVSVVLVGKPEAGRTWQLDYPFGAGADGGAVDAGTLLGRGYVDYTEGCLGAGTPRNSWVSSGGTLTVDAVNEPTVAGAGATPGAIKAVTFTLSGVQLGPGSAGAQGTMRLDGNGAVALFQGMNLP